jgi:hypothetical protein
MEMRIVAPDAASATAPVGSGRDVGLIEQG